MKNFKIEWISWIALIILILLLMYQCNSNNNLSSKNVNFLAATDTLRIVKNNLGEEIGIKNVYISDKKKLEKVNKELGIEVERLIGDVLFFQSSSGTINTIYDTINTTDTLIKYIEIHDTLIHKPDGSSTIVWSLDTSYNKKNARSFKGSTSFNVDSFGLITNINTKLIKDEIKFNIITGLTELDNSYQIFIKSDYPGLVFNSIEGAILDKKRFMQESNESDVVFGPYIGYGLGYNHVNQTFGPTISIGLSITYNLNKHFKKLFKKKNLIQN